MLEKQFVEDLVENARVHSAFAVKEKSLVAFRSKPGKFLNLVLTDRTGEITARVWDHAEEMAETFEPGDVVVVKGAVQDYQGQLQLIASQVTPAAIDEYDMEDLVPTAGRSREELERWLDATIERVVNPDLRALLDAFFQEPGFREQMATAFGARSLHHSYAGGLLEHTLSVVQLLLAAAEIHPEMDKDLLITGGLLHDIGKLEELAGVTVADYTDVGKFIGHTVLSDRMIQERIRSIKGFDPHLANLLAHMVLSHHGEREWGAPITPATMEACALHYADNMDARVQGFKQVIQAGASSEAEWSEYHRSYQRQIYLGRKERMPSGPASDQPDESGGSGGGNGGQLAF